MGHTKAHYVAAAVVVFEAVGDAVGDLGLAVPSKQQSMTSCHSPNANRNSFCWAGVDLNICRDSGAQGHRAFHRPLQVGRLGFVIMYLAAGFA